MRLRIEDVFLRKWSDYSLALTRGNDSACDDIHDAKTGDFWARGNALASRGPNARLITTDGLGHGAFGLEAS